MASDVTISNSSRAGIASFGCDVVLEGSTLECNAIHLDGEESDGVAATFSNAGDNACGCAEEAVSCKILSTNLKAPDPTAL